MSTMSILGMSLFYLTHFDMLTCEKLCQLCQYFFVILHKLYISYIYILYSSVILSKQRFNEYLLADLCAPRLYILRSFSFSLGFSFYSLPLKYRKVKIRGEIMYYIISFGENEFLYFRYKTKCNIVVITHCLFSAKRWKTPIGVYRVAKHLPKSFRDWVIIYKVTVENHMPKVVCRWNLSAFLSFVIEGV